MAARRRRTGVVGAAALTLVLALAGCGSHRPVVLSVTPSVSSADGASAIRVTGLAHDADASLTVDATDAGGRAWHSAVVLRADSHGAIDTATASAPPGGSYAGVFTDGLVAMLRPVDDAAPASFTFPTPGAVELRFAASVDGTVVATATQERALADPGVATTTFRHADHGFDGVYARPTDTTTRRPAVLLLGGSEGGNSQVLNARLLAAHGVPALAVAYFNAPGRPTEFPDLPKDLKDIPLEYVGGALAWLAAQPGVDPQHVRVDGGSRGSEAALLAGIDFPTLVHGVVAVVPTDEARPALLAERGRQVGDQHHSAWTYRGREVPWAAQTGGVTTGVFDARFAVEKIQGPVLFVCGDADEVWASCPASRQMDARLTGAGFGFPHQVLGYPDGGHGVSRAANIPFVDDPQAPPLDGVTGQSNPLASADAWPKTVAFLQSR